MLFSRNATEGALVYFMVVSKLQDFCELGTIDPTYNLDMHRSSWGKAEPRSLGETDVGMSPIGQWWVFQFPF
jgi:hypothetical protein